jgi:transcriptional regulator with XRE-family HTH domain
MVRAAKTWGARLSELRQATGLSAAAVVKQLAEFGIVLDRASIYAYENGRVAAPDAAVVWGLARIYNVKLEDLVEALVDARAPMTAQPQQSRRTTLSSDERRAVEGLRKLERPARKACLDFLDFQLTLAERRHRKRSRPVD